MDRFQPSNSPHFAVGCQRGSCHATATSASTMQEAREHALREGWTFNERGQEWSCPAHRTPEEGYVGQLRD